jgi:hypothetical protein
MVFIKDVKLEAREILSNSVQTLNIKPVKGLLGGLIRELVIKHLRKQFGVVTSIRRADLPEKKGWVVLELEG